MCFSASTAVRVAPYHPRSGIHLQLVAHQHVYSLAQTVTQCCSSSNPCVQPVVTQTEISLAYISRICSITRGSQEMPAVSCTTCGGQQRPNSHRLRSFQESIRVAPGY